MKPSRIRKLIEWLQQRKRAIDAQINKLMALCPHELVTGRYCREHNNYYNDNSYWIEAKCEDCGRNIDAFAISDRELYSRLAKSKLILPEHPNDKQLTEYLEARARILADRETEA